MTARSGFRGRFVVLLAILVVAVFSSTITFANELVFGPVTCQRGTGAPTVFSYSFAAPESSRGFIFKVYNGGLEDTTYEQVSSSTITLNGTEILGSNNFNQNVTYLEVPVSLQTQNSLSVEVRGKPGGAIIAKVFPLVVIDTPASGQAFSATAMSVAGHLYSEATGITVNGVPGTLAGTNFTVSDIPLVEGINDLTAVAVRTGGFTGLASVTITRDTTPPTITLTYPQDGATVSVPSVDVIGSVNEASAVVLVNGSAVTLAGAAFAATDIPLQIGLNTISVEARDPLGNSSTTVLHVNYAPPLPTATLTAVRSQVQLGTPSALQWATTGATTISITPEIGAVAASGTLAINPTATTTYIVTAAGPGGTVTAETMVTVTYPPPSVTLSAAPETILEGTSATLSWMASNASSCSIEPGLGAVAVSGVSNVSPTAITIYTISCSGAGGTATASTTVNITYLPPTVSLSAAPASVLHGTASTLSWSSSHAQTCILDNGIGSVPCNGSIFLAPNATTIYVLTAVGQGGTTTAQATVSVTYPAPTVTIVSSTKDILLGDSATLSWDSTDAESCVIDNGIGSVQCNGSIAVAPATTTTYSISAIGQGGTRNAETTVTVAQLTGNVNISASSSTIHLGESTTLSWTATDATGIVINQGIGVVQSTGTKVVQPTSTTEYVITAAGVEGAFKASVVVTVLGNVNPQPEGSFGAKYQDLIPQDATVDSYDPRRFSLLTGLARGRNSLPLSGVGISIYSHPEYGTVQTDNDGRFSIPVEGGGVHTVIYERTGMLTVHRQVNVPWNDIAIAETVEMIVEDQAVSTVTFDGNPLSIVQHKSTTVIDEAGTRSCTLVFSGDNHAYALIDNNEVELSTIKVRATEYDTPRSMPAKLPPSSAYTYCVELHVDGVERVRFTKPVVLYLDNFLGFPVGTIVPVGYYDNQQAVWVPSDNGLVVRLLDTNNDGKVDALDSDGDGIPNDLDFDGSYLDEVMGISSDSSYSSGKTYWRASTNHFSPVDLNFPGSPPEGSTPPNSGHVPIVSQQRTDAEPENVSCPGSYAENRSRVFHEEIPIPGTDIKLHYASNRVEGYNTVLDIPVSGATIPASLKGIVVEGSIAGKEYNFSLLPAANQSVQLVWDGKDYLGNILNGLVIVKVRIGFVYDMVYAIPNSEIVQAFGEAGYEVINIKGREVATSWETRNIELYATGNMGDYGKGWTISEQHQGMSAKGDLLLMGDGRIHKQSIMQISTFAGDGTRIFGQENEPAAKTSIARPVGIATDGVGNVYFTDFTFNRIRKIDREGLVTTIAGNTTMGFSGDGGDARVASLAAPMGIAVDSKGNVYVADTNNNRIRKIDTNGVISTIAGSGPGYVAGWNPGGYEGDNGPAIFAQLYHPMEVEVDNNGNIYIADTHNHRIRKINTANIIVTIAGNGAQDLLHPGYGTFGGDGGRAVNAGLSQPFDVTLDAQGSIYIADSANQRIRKVDPSGIISTVAGNGNRGNTYGSGTFSGDGGLAVNAGLNTPIGIVVSQQGEMFIADANNYRIRSVDVYGIISTFAGSASFKYNGDGILPTEARMSPEQLCFDQSGFILIADQYNNRIRKVKYVSSAGGIFYDEDRGYEFDSEGKHVRTVDTKTGTTIYVFSYAGTGKLNEIRDTFGNTISIGRSSDGMPIYIESQNGQRTDLDMSSSGFLRGLAFPDGSNYQFEYNDSGLLIFKHDPMNNIFSHSFDSNGRLQTASDPEGGIWQYSQLVSQDGKEYSYAYSAEGNNIINTDYRIDDGSMVSETINPSGDQEEVKVSKDHLRTTTRLMCGTTETIDYALDKLHGFRYARSRSFITPNGINYISTRASTYIDSNSDGIVDAKNDSYLTNGRSWATKDNLLSGLLTRTSPTGRVRSMSYNPVTLLPMQETVAGLLDTSYEYDERGRLMSIKKGSRILQLAYDENGNLDSILTPDNKAYDYTNDIMGRLRSELRPDGSIIGYQYDANGNRIVLVNPSEISYSFDYTANNQRQNYVQPLSGIYQYSYDRDRRMKVVTAPSGETITYTYLAGNIATTTTSEGVTSYDYLCASRLRSATRNGESVSFGYDGPLVTSDTRNGTLAKSISYTYNNDFAPTSLTYADTMTTLGYDADGLLTAADGYTISRNAQNGLPNSVSGNGITQSRVFSGYGEMDGSVWNAGAVSPYQWNVSRDVAGRITQRIEVIGGDSITWEYVYDILGRLIEVNKNTALVESYSYDANGNRLSEMNSLRGIIGRSFGHSIEDHVLTAGSDSYVFDVDGFFQSKATSEGATDYDYSSRGELQRADLPDGKILTYIHDPMGRRIAKQVNGSTVEKYLWKDQTTLLAVYDGSDNLLQRYAYADARAPVSMTAGGATYFLLTDQVGTLRAIADTSGAIVKRIDYDSFGNIVSDSNPSFSVPFGFAGGLHDRDTGLVRFGARDYDPSIGRFTAKDPIDFDGGDTNLYSYVTNDPINLVDPDGKNPLLLGAVIGAVLATSMSSSDANAPESPEAELFPPQSMFEAGLVAAAGANAGICSTRFRGPEWGRWKDQGNWTEGYHFHLGSKANGLGGHHLPQQFGNWVRNLLGLLRK